MSKRSKGLTVKTKRLAISLMSDEKMNILISGTVDDGLKAAYGEMLKGSIENPTRREWFAAWKICLKENGEIVGNACFMGEPADGAVTIGYGINPGKEGNGFATEAVKALSEWAFSKENVYFIIAETEKQNIASQRVLDKNGFKPDGDGEEGARFMLEKPVTSWMSIYMCIGMSVGLCFGSATDNLALGIGCGMPIGMLIGLLLDTEDKKKRKELKDKRNKQ